MNGICDYPVYAKKSKDHNLINFYDLVVSKSYYEEENSREHLSAVQHLWNWIKVLYKDYFDKLQKILLQIDNTSQMAKPIIKSVAAKWNWI